jgi:hypothetical protein
MAFAFDAGRLVDDVQNSITFADRFGGTFGDTCTARDAVFKNFHGHGRDSYKWISCEIKLSPSHNLRQWTNISCLVNFVTFYPKYEISWYPGRNPKIPKDI